MRGLIIRCNGTSYGVRLDSGGETECRIKGNFRIRGIRSTNPVAVGDRVEVEEGWIKELLPRKNYIIRRATNLSFESHIIAANVDVAVIVVTVNHPRTSLTFIDRFLATAEAYRVPGCILFNKVDMLEGEEKEEMERWREMYERLGYRTMVVSALRAQSSPQELEELRELIRGKVALLSGNSGVGKSTLINALMGKEMTRTHWISSVHNKGTHTTTFSEMYPLDGGWVVDTPGIKGFGILDVKKEEVCHYFREIFEVSHACRYSDCSHVDEPGCAVVEAVREGRIALSRYESYLSVLGDVKEEKYRR